MAVKNPSCSVVILAAGRGERMRSLGVKPLLEIAGKKMLAYSLDLARNFKPSEIVVALSEEAKSGTDLLNGQEKSVIVPPLGTLESAIRALEVMETEPMWLLFCQADDAVFYREDIFQDLLNLAERQNVNIATTAVKVTAPLPLGPIEIEDGMMTSFSFDRSTPPPKFVLSGIYLIKTASLKKYEPQIIPAEKGERTLVHLIKASLEAGERIAVLEIPEREWSIINTPEDLMRARSRKEANA